MRHINVGMHFQLRKNIAKHFLMVKIFGYVHQHLPCLKISLWFWFLSSAMMIEKENLLLLMGFTQVSQGLYLSTAWSILEFRNMSVWLYWWGGAKHFPWKSGCQVERYWKKWHLILENAKLSKQKNVHPETPTPPSYWKKMRDISLRKMPNFPPKKPFIMRPQPPPLVGWDFDKN